MGVVVFAAMLGFAVLTLRKDNPELGDRVLKGIETFQALILRLVRMVLRLTPYGVLALMVRVVATSNVNDIVNLGGFVVASYVGLALILLMHAAIIGLAGLSPVRFYQKIWPALTFAFTSRSSAATIPAQRRDAGEPTGRVAGHRQLRRQLRRHDWPERLRRALSVDARHHDCAKRRHRSRCRCRFSASVVAVATIGSIGIAGVGGGATFAALVVLSSLNLPVALAGLLISVEPLIDMGRTAINVSGSMTAGTVTSRWLGQTDMAVFTADEPIAPTAAEDVATAPAGHPAVPVA